MNFKIIRVMKTIPKIIEIKKIEDNQIIFLVDDGTYRKINFEEFFNKHSSKFAEKLLTDKVLFSEVKLMNDTLGWEKLGIESKDVEGKSVFYPYEIDPLVLIKESKEEITLPKEIGLVIRQKRLEYGISQKELAEKSGISPQQLSKIEKRSNYNLKSIQKVIRQGFSGTMEILISV